MNSTCKLFEVIINNRLKFNNDMLNQDDPLQNGFVEKGRTLDNVFILYTAVKMVQAEGKSLYCCFIDFTKAFDYINRKALFYKLICNQVKGKALQVLMNLYEKSHSRVRVKSELSENIDSLYGVLQGGVLSPKLFNTFLSDIAEHLDLDCGVDIYGMNVAYLLYADDLVLMSSSPDKLQSQLNKLFQYCRKWHLIVNMTKSNIMIFNDKRKKNTYNFKYGDATVEKVESYKYLGFILNTSHKDIFFETYDQLWDKGRKAAYEANSCCYQHIGKPDPRMALKVFDSQIRPCLDYGCEIWGMSKGNKIEKLETIQLKYIKSMLGVRKQTTTAAVYADTGRVPLKVQWEIQALRYWERVINLQESHILNKCYLKLSALETTGQVNWCRNIKCLLTSLGMRYAQLWNMQATCEDPKAINAVTEIINCRYRDQVMNEVFSAGEGKKLRTYKKFKSEFRLEHYLFCIPNQNHRIALSRYRLSSHNLGIETGRHCRPPKPACDRICLHCSSGAIDDEIHLLTDCDFHSVSREHFMTTISGKMHDYQEMSNLDKFISVMKTSDAVVIKALAKFVCTAFTQRQQV